MVKKGFFSESKYLFRAFKKTKILKKPQFDLSSGKYFFKNLYQKIRSMSIAVKIIAYISIIIILIMIAANAATYLITYNRMTDMNISSMKSISNEIYVNFQNLIELQTSDIDKISLNADVIELTKKRHTIPRVEFGNIYAADINLLNKKMKQYSKGNTSVENIFVADSEGIVFISSDNEFLNNVISSKDYYKKAMEGIKSVSDIYTSPITGKPVITFIQPLADEKGSIIGAIGKNVSTDYFSQRFDNFSFLKNGFIFIIDNSHNIIYHPNKYFINKKVEISAVNKLLDDKNIFSKKNIRDFQYMKDGKRYKAVCVSVPDIKIMIILTIEEASIKENSNLIGLIIAGITLLMISIIIPVLYITIKKILRPLTVLKNNAMELSNGNLVINNKINRQDEIGQLGKSFNTMTNNIKELLIGIKGVVSKLVDVSHVITDAQEETSAGIEVIDLNYQNIAIDIDKINSVINRSFESTQKTADMTAQVKDMSEEMLDKAINIRKLNNNGLESISSLQMVNQETLIKIQNVNNTFSELGVNLEDIKKIICLVNNISTQTNILSLNASIEAARAGEQGRGFSVVAEEIRKLSDNTSEQMKKVEYIINSIYTKMDKMQSDMDVVNRVSSKQTCMVDDVIDKFNNIAGSTDSIVNYIEGTNNQIELLNQESQNVIEKLGEVMELVLNFNSSILEIKGIVKGQSDRTKIMEGLLVELKCTTNELNSNINKFKV